MTESSFTTVVSNNLEQITMIAGDEQIFVYNVYNTDATPLIITAASCTVFIFPYGNPTYIIETIAGSPSSTVSNQFSAIFSGVGLSGVYQQQVRIVDTHGKIHFPAQGKIIIFPSSEE